MNSKTLILAGLMLMAGAIGSRASQTEIVYPGYNYLTCQVQSGQVNTILNCPDFPANASDPNGVNNWVLYLWADYRAYEQAYYFTAADATAWVGIPSPAGWYDMGGNYMNWTLNDGQGFILVAANANFLGNIITLIGTPGTVPSTLTRRRAMPSSAVR
jgi:hypothetical protein